MLRKKKTMALLAVILLLGCPVGQPQSDLPSDQNGDSTPPRNTVKIASFNIQIFGQTKASKPEVMDILAKIIRRYDIVAIQEIRDAAQSTCNSLFYKELLIRQLKLEICYLTENSISLDVDGGMPSARHRLSCPNRDRHGSSEFDPPHHLFMSDLRSSHHYYGRRDISGARINGNPSMSRIARLCSTNRPGTLIEDAL